MLVFMKNIKKFLNTEGTSLRAIHYHQGRAYASNRHSCIWVEDASGREGVFDTVGNRMVENAVIPNYDKLLPQLYGNEPYAVVGDGDFTELLAILKAVIACAPHRKAIECVLLVWRQGGLAAYTRGHSLRLDYQLSGGTESLRLIGEQTFYAAFDACRLLDIVDYFRQRKAPVRFYAPGSSRAILRMEVDRDIISAIPAGGLLAPLSKFEKDRFADVIPVETDNKEA
mgnify:CR=1 FL=1